MHSTVKSYSASRRPAYAITAIPRPPAPLADPFETGRAIRRSRRGRENWACAVKLHIEGRNAVWMLRIDRGQESREGQKRRGRGAPQVVAFWLGAEVLQTHSKSYWK